MIRKRWSAKTEITPALLKSREKRKWQIALRRYVLEKNISVSYAPYFGLDIENLRKWFELQFDNNIQWSDFAKKWQFGHRIAVTYFDSSNEEELRLCWHFTNLRIEQLQLNKNMEGRPDILQAKQYFTELYQKTLFLPCEKFLQKIKAIELSEIVSYEKQQSFILNNKTYLDIIENYSPHEFKMLNNGKNVDQIKKEIAFLKKFEDYPL